MRVRFWEDCDSSRNLSLPLGTFSVSVWVLWDALDFVVHKMTFAVLLWIFWFKQVCMFTTSHHFGSSICSAFDWGKQNHLQSRETDPFKVKSSRFVMCPINSANKFRRTRVESYSLDSAVIFFFYFSRTRSVLSLWKANSDFQPILDHKTKSSDCSLLSLKLSLVAEEAEKWPWMDFSQLCTVQIPLTSNMSAFLSMSWKILKWFKSIASQTCAR